MTAKIEWNVIVFDKPNADRLPFRTEHLNKIPHDVNAGIIKSVGAIYHDVEKTKFAGSAYHILASSKEEVIEFLKGDAFYKNGVWDINSVIAHPIGIRSRLPTKLDGTEDSLYKI